MDRSVLFQLKDIHKEIWELEKRIQVHRKRLKKIDKQVSDVVKGTGRYGCYGNMRVHGHNDPNYIREKMELNQKLKQMESLKLMLLEKEVEAEKYIESIQESRLRRILRFRFEDEMTWQQVAKAMGGRCTADGCRMEYNRWIMETGSDD